jgi:hypothetical protein
MTGIVLFNVLTIALAVAVGFGLVSTARVSSMLEWLHAIIGITPPEAAHARIFAVVWIASTIVLVDGMLFMLVYLTTHLMSR